MYLTLSSTVLTMFHSMVRDFGRIEKLFSAVLASSFCFGVFVKKKEFGPVLCVCRFFKTFCVKCQRDETDYVTAIQDLMMPLFLELFTD